MGRAIELRKRKIGALNPLSDGEGITAGCDKSRVTGAPAQILYTSATQVAAVVPASISGATAQVAVSYQGAVSNALNIDVALSSPGIFTLNQTGAGQAAAINADGLATRRRIQSRSAATSRFMRLAGVTPSCPWP